jgi:predicted transcriptional regulator
MAQGGPNMEMTKTTIRLPAALFKKAKHHAVDSNRDLQDIIADALAGYLKAAPKGGK